MTSAAHVQMRMRKSNMLHCKYHGLSVTKKSTTLGAPRRVKCFWRPSQRSISWRQILIFGSLEPKLLDLRPGVRTPGITGPGSPQRPGFCGAWRIDWKASERTCRTWTGSGNHGNFHVLGHVLLNFRGHVNVNIPAPWSNMFWWFGSFVDFSICWE